MRPQRGGLVNRKGPEKDRAQEGEFEPNLAEGGTFGKVGTCRGDEQSNLLDEDVHVPGSRPSGLQIFALLPPTFFPVSHTHTPHPAFPGE